ncbi:MAG: hypothetical protein HYZ81_13160 [Nitrospinae bacterium]|nr:hypothetical protein [Nitrospinota bacterium]
MRIRSRLAKASPKLTEPCPSLPIWLGLLASLLMMVGGIWDISWHRTIGRDTFWSPPHLFIYSGVSMMGLACVAVVGRAMVAHKTGPRADPTLVELWGLRAPLGFAIAGFGVLGLLLSAPIDEWWHRMFGVDVTVWSPPHLFAIAAAAAVRVGLILALVREMHLAGQLAPPAWLLRSWRGMTVAEWVQLFLFSLLLGNLTFALGEYDYLAASRDPFLYPILASLAVPVVLVAGVRSAGRVGSATVIVLLLMARRELMSVVLLATDFIPPSPSPLYLVPAVVVDFWFWLVRRTPDSAWRSVAAGILFAWIFVLTEYMYTGYLTGVFWSISPLVLGEPLACVAGAVSAWAGHHLFQSSRRMLP